MLHLLQIQIKVNNMKVKKIVLALFFITSILSAQSGAYLFKTYCLSCHAEIIGVSSCAGKLTNVYRAPCIKAIIKKLKIKTKTKAKFVSFIKNYVKNPSKKKALYSKRAIKEYGVMPSLNYVLSDKESTKLANYLYSDHVQEKITLIKKVNKPIKETSALFIKHCSSCHAKIIGIDESGGRVTLICNAPHIKYIVKKLKVKTKTKAKFVSFIKDYINNPSKEKALYSKRAIKKFGIMPTLNGVLSDKESTEIANDLYENY